jgi:hypothetical protein
MKSLVLTFAVVLFLCGPSLAQNLIVQTVEPQKTAAGDPADDWKNEQQRRILALQKLQRDHSDQRGHLRPDLVAKANAQIQRMGVANQIGPAPKVANPVK